MWEFVEPICYIGKTDESKVANCFRFKPVNFFEILPDAGTRVALCECQYNKIGFPGWLEFNLD